MPGPPPGFGDLPHAAIRGRASRSAAAGGLCGRKLQSGAGLAAQRIQGLRGGPRPAQGLSPSNRIAA